ncbi:hypothetical protein O6H91_Y352200 [Diphasiastrum complanatum]|nr:hypothetical protein O6H91_Y352200 [Diphasiastrum complanatum]
MNKWERLTILTDILNKISSASVIHLENLNFLKHQTKTWKTNLRFSGQLKMYSLHVSCTEPASFPNALALLNTSLRMGPWTGGVSLLPLDFCQSRLLPAAHAEANPPLPC